MWKKQDCCSPGQDSILTPPEYEARGLSILLLNQVLAILNLSFIDIHYTTIQISVTCNKLKFNIA
jgi:hypothetical protein